MPTIFIVHHSLFFGLALLMIAGFFGGVVDTLSGGGGLVCLPVLLSVGMPPVVAFGTNKMQGLIGESVSLWRFFRHKQLDFSSLKWPLLIVAISAMLGAWSVIMIHADALKKIIPFLLLAIWLYMLLVPGVGEKDVKPRIGVRCFYGLVGSVIAFYNGFFGPGTGSFWVFALIFFLGFHHQRAVIQMKPLNLMGNFGSLVLFVIAGKVNYLAVLVMAVGQIFGAYLASHLVLTQGRKLIRPLFLIIVGLMIIDLIVKSYFFHSL